jgi:hypothetical protein
MGHHYVIWASESNILLAQIFFFRAGQRLTLISGTAPILSYPGHKSVCTKFEINIFTRELKLMSPL